MANSSIDKDESRWDKLRRIVVVRLIWFCLGLITGVMTGVWAAG